MVHINFSIRKKMESAELDRNDLLKYIVANKIEKSDK